MTDDVDPMEPMPQANQPGSAWRRVSPGEFFKGSRLFKSSEELWNAACEFFEWVEDNPLKVGKTTPGMHIPIVSVDEMLAREVPLRRLGQPEEIADIVAFLSSPRAAFITGTVIVADGGQLRA